MGVLHPQKSRETAEFLACLQQAGASSLPQNSLCRESGGCALRPPGRHAEPGKRSPPEV